MKLNVKKLDENAIIPTYGTEYSAGADLYVPANQKSIAVNPHKTVLVKLGIAVEIPEGYVGLIFARSGMATKRSLAPANKVGVIDSDYRGELMVALHNHSDELQCVEAGERIAPLSVVPFLKCEFSEVSELSETVRGEGGFGSTGSK